MLGKAYSVQSVRLSIEKKKPPNLVISTTGEANSTGWKNFKLLPYVYIVPPADGIYEFDLVGEKPDGIVLPVITEIDPPPEAFVWEAYPETEVKGVTVYASSNCKTEML